MSEPIQSISNGNYILQGTVATSAGIVGDGSTQNPIRADETVLFEDANGSLLKNGITLTESRLNFERIKITYAVTVNGCPSEIEIPMLGVNRGTSFIQTLIGSYDNHTQDTAGYFLVWQLFFADCTETYLKSSNAHFMGKSGFNGVTAGSWTQGSNADCPIVYKIIGINRIANI